MSLQYGPVDPKALFGEITKIFDIKIKEKGLKLIKDIDSTLPAYLMLDEVRIRQVLFNLVGNAVKFTREGYIELKVKGLFYPDRSKIDLIFSVKDTGIGITEGDKKVIFDAFGQSGMQSVKQYGGTGLGLAVTKKLTKLMGGQLSLESVVGKGSTFIVKINEVSVAAVESGIEEKNEILKRLSITDGLTGLYNYRYIVGVLSRLVEENKRYKKTLTIGMFDIDDFKKINDMYGHPFGDDVLVKVANLAEGYLRKTDLIGRYGGEEFLVLFAHTDLSGAIKSANRIIKGVSQLNWENKDIKINMSAGLCEKKDEDISELIKKADEMLYAAKKKGKNRVEPDL